MASEVVYKPVEKTGNIYPGGTLTPPKFMPGYYEWLSTKGLQIGRAGSGTLYTVPDNHILFITSAFISAYNTDAAVAGTFHMYVQTTGRAFLGLAIPQWKSNLPGDTPQPYPNISMSNSFSIPIVANAGEIIYNDTAPGSITLVAGFTGFLINYDDLPVF